MNETSYPLFWPTGKPRIRSRRPSRFGTSSYKRPTIDASRRFLFEELGRLKAKNTVLSTNQELRLDGLPRSDRRPPEDPGAAVYFTLDGKRIVLSCDQWIGLGCNIWAIAKHIEALRGQDRWGVGSVEQAFAGYVALPAPTAAADNCWTVLGMTGNPIPSRDEIDRQYRALAQKSHPDVAGGSHDAMSRLNAAREAALAFIAR